MRVQQSRRGRPWISFLGCCAALALLGLFTLATTADAAALIVNEYNCVDSDRYLLTGSYSGGQNPDPDPLDPIKEDSYFGTIPNMPDGRIEGNGGNWVELVVLQDHLDLRGWSLKWAETGADATNGTDLWFGDPDVEQGIITFSPTAAIWSDVRSGTIITISEKDSIGVDTDFDGADRNFTDNPPTAVDVTIPLHTDPSFIPFAGDWWIHISSRQEQADGTLLISTLTNVTGDGAGDFSVGPDDWQISVFNDSDARDFGPIGEDIDTFGNFPGGISSSEAGRLEAHPVAGVNNDDYDDVTSTSFGQANEWGDSVQDFSELRGWIPEPGTVAMLLSAAVSLLLFWRRTRKA